MPVRKEIQSQVTFFYHCDLAPIACFYEAVMGFEVVGDHGWANIYRVSGNAFLGIVAGDRGFQRPHKDNAVLLTLVVDDVPAWYAHLRDRGVSC